MATTFTGLRVQDTYNAIIKIGDNSTLTGTGKLLSDGYGNSSNLYLSTTRLGIGVVPTENLHIGGSMRLTGSFKDKNNESGSIGQVLTSTATGTDWKTISDIDGVTSTTGGTANYVPKFTSASNIENSIIQASATLVTISGNLDVNGTVTYIDTIDLSVKDPLIKLANANVSNTLDIGFYGKYVVSATTKYLGLYSDSSNSNKFRLFTGLETEPTTVVDSSDTTFAVGTLIANFEGDLTGNVTGNLTGNVTGNVTGNLTGNVTGNLTGNVTGGTITGTSATITGSANMFKIINTSTTVNHYAQMRIQAGSADNYIWTANQNSTSWGGPNSLNIYTQQAGAIAFFTSGNNIRMTIGATGDTTFTGLVSGIAPTADLNFATKKYVDDSIPVVPAAPALSDVLAVGNTSGAYDIQMDDSQKLLFGATDDLEIFENVGNSYMINNTGNLYIENFADDKDIVFINDDGTGGNAVYLFMDGSEVRNKFFQNVQVNDNKILEIGSGQDMKIYHDITDTFIANSTGDLTISNATDDGDIIFQGDNGASPSVLTEYMRIDGGFVRTVFSKSTQHQDAVYGFYGASSDLKIGFDATDSLIVNSTGDLYITNSADDKDIIFSSDDGSGGIVEYFRVDGSESRVTFGRRLMMADNVRLAFGNSNNGEIWYDSTAAKVLQSGIIQFADAVSVDDDFTVTGTLDFPGTAAQYVKGDGALATFPAIPQGDITAITVGNGLAGTSLSGPIPDLTMSGSYTGTFTLNNGTNITTFDTTAYQLIIKNSYNNSASGMALRSANDTFVMQMYGETTQYGFLASEWGAWNIRKVVSGGLYLNNNTTYFVQPEGTSNMNAATFAGAVTAPTYNGLAINTTGLNNVADQIVRTQVDGYAKFGWINSVSGATTATITRITASDDAYLRYVTPATFRSQIITGYYLPLAGGIMTGDIGRSSSIEGYQVGTYNNVGANSTHTSPIYTIGTSYNPALTTLSDMYGVGFTQASAASFVSITGAAGWGMYVAANGFAKVFLDGGNGRVSVTDAMYSPIYYDQSNAAYYGDFNSTSYSLNGAGSLKIIGGVGSDGDSPSTQNQAVRVSMPNGAARSWDGTVTGAIKITLPVGSNDTMWSMKVRIYNYATNQTSEYTLGNYNYNLGGYNSSASFNGAAGMPAKTVRWGNDGTKNCVWIGETNSSWVYPVVSVVDFQGGYRNGNATTWTNGWDISLVTSFYSAQTSITPSTQVGYIGYATDSFRAPIFYDSDNTAYFVNPSAATSARLYGFVKIGNSVDYNTDDGNWGSRLIVASTVHARIDVAQDVNDVRSSWFCHTGQLYSSFGTVTSHAQYLMSYNSVRQKLENGYSQEEGSYRAPLFYDSNDTSYYINPNSDISAIFAGSIGVNNTSPVVTAWGSATTTKQLTITGSNYGVLNLQGSYTALTKYSMGVGGNQFYMAYDNIAGRHNIIVNSSGNVNVSVDVRAPVFYDSDNTAYYADFASYTYGAYYGRLSSIEGYQVGSYNNVGANHSHSNPIYTIGSSYMPALTTLSNMYGIGFTRGDASFLGVSVTSGWGMYVASAGAARVFLDGEHGTASVTSAMYSPIYYDTSTAYYGDFASESRMASIRIGGAGYSVLSADNSQNTKFQGNSGASCGITGFGSTGAHVFQIYGSGTNYGFLNGNWAAWDLRKAKNGALFLNGSSVNYLDGSEVVYSIFKDSANTAYYLDPANTGTSLNVAGTGIFGGDVVAYSDKKLKTNIKTLNGSKVLKMRGVSFDRIDTGKHSSGVIAQEIQEIAPELVNDKNGTLAVAYGNLTGYLIEAIKDQQIMIDDLKKRLKTLENN